MTREIETRGNDASLYAGFDVGSSFVHYAVLRSDKSVVYSPAPLMHFANPLGALREAWEDVTERFGLAAIRSTALTGSATHGIFSTLAPRTRISSMWQWLETVA